MNVKEEKTCRICLNEVYKEFEVLDETARSMFDVLLLKMDWDVSKEPVMCQECAEVTRKCFAFKTTCVNTENLIRSFTVGKMEGKLDLRNVVDETVQPAVCEDFNICRFCADRLEPSSFVSLKMLSIEPDMLQKLIPEMDFNVTENPLICTRCRESLECYVTFVQNCIDVEEKLRKHCQGRGIDDLSQIKLRDILGKDPLGDGTILPVIKVETDTFEEVLIKTEDPLDIKDKALNFVAISSKTEPIDQFDACLRNEISDTSDIKHSRDDSWAIIHVGHSSEVKTDDCSVRTNQNTSETKRYHCSTCTYSTQRKSNLVSHLLMHKDASDIKTYKCSVCTFQTKYKSNLSTHLLIHKDASEITKMYKCSACSFETKHRRHFTSHLLTHKDASETETYKCPACTFQTKYKNNLSTHVLTHQDASESKMYKCSHCDFETKHKRYLATHLLIHKDASETKMYKCSVCTYETKHKRNLIRHLLVHKDASETDMYSCSFCTYETKNREYLSKHLLIHKDASEIKMHKCPVCTYETKYRSVLNTHLTTHKDSSETKMYNCLVCTFDTKHKRYLNTHLLIHKDVSQATMYKCSFCTYETKRKNCITKHLLVHKDGPEIKMYKCSVCMFKTKYKSALTRHLLNHKETKTC